MIAPVKPFFKKKGIILNFFQSFFDYFFRKCYTFGRKEMIVLAIGKGKVRKNLVFPVELYDRLLVQAEKEHRQISGLICWVMEKYLEEQKKKKG
jgi:hypothetical protein